MQIKLLTNNLGINEILKNLPQGHGVVLDIDRTLLHNAVIKYSDHDPVLTEINLPALLNYLRETGHPVLLLTARKQQEELTTRKQLKQSGLNYDDLIHAPEDKGRALADYLQKYPDIKHWHIIDNKAKQLQKIAHALTVLNKQANYYHYQPNTLLLTENHEKPDFPKTLDSITCERSLHGGTASTFKVKDSHTQQEYVAKFGSNEAQIKIEILLNLLYHRLGVPVAQVQAYNVIPKKLAKSLGLPHTARTIQLAEWFESAANQEKQKIIEQARRDFIVHAFTGNIDVAKTDNFILTPCGEVKFIDAGANFIFRALGGSRNEQIFELSEIDSLRNKQINPNAAQWFGDLSESEIQEQVKKLLSQRDVIEHTLWDISQQLELPAFLQQQILSGFSHRFDKLAQRYGFVVQSFAKRDKIAVKDKTAAGVMHIRRDQKGELYVLLSQRKGHKWCDNFGGKSEYGDDSLARTAQRECSEESSGVLQYSDQELATAPFHDLITSDSQGNQFLYRMYFVESSTMIHLNDLKDTEHTKHYWVALGTLYKALISNTQITEEDKITIQTHDANQQDIILFPPLYNMLNQCPVHTLIDSLLKGEIPSHHTQGTLSNNANHSPVTYLPITSPEQIKTDITHTLLHKSRVLNDIKQQQRHHFFSSPITHTALKSSLQLSQSELHLLTVMGQNFQITAPIETNIRLFLNKYSPRLNCSEDEKEKLIAESVEMIQREKDHPEQVYFYHGVNGKIAFAYTLYTELYRILAANNSIHALRTDTMLFHKCLNIQEFITHFQNVSHEKNNNKHLNIQKFITHSQDASHVKNNNINNYSKDYIASAISANMFLFGSYQYSSYSIGYYTNNTSKIDIKDTLLESLKLMGVNEEFINHEIKNLMSIYPYIEQGALYQISLPQHEASMYTYTAQPGGALKPFSGEQGETTDITQILNQLKNKMSEKDYNYIRYAQIRIMVPPGIPLNINTYHGGTPADQQTLAFYKKKLNDTAQKIAFDIIQHLNQSNKLNSKMPLTRYLPQIHQQAGLNPGLMKTTDELIIQLIEEGDYKNIKTILEIYPQYKEKPLISMKLKDPAETLLIRLLKVPSPDKVIHAFYDNRFYEGDFDASSFEKIYPIILAVKAEKKLHFAMMQHDKVKDNTDLMDILTVLPDMDKINFLRLQQDKIKDISELIEVLKNLPEINKIEFAQLQQDKIKDISELIQVLENLPEINRIEFAQLQQDKIKHSYEISNILKVLPKANRIEFAQLQQNKIECAFDISRILEALPNENIMEFVKLHKNKIKDGWGLRYVLDHIPHWPLLPERTKFALLLEDRIKNGKELIDILYTLSHEDQAKFTESQIDKIKNVSELTQVLKYFFNNSYDIHKKLNSKIHNIDKFVQIIDTLNQILEMIPDWNKIQNISELVQILKILPQKVTFIDELIQVLEIIPNWSQIKLDVLPEKIQNIGELIEILKGLPNKITFAELHQDKIQNSQELTQVLEALPDINRMSFTKTHNNKIQNADDFSLIFKILPATDKINFTQLHQYKIQNINELTQVLNVLTKKEAFIYACTLKDKIQNASELIQVLKYLYMTDAYEYANLLHDKVQNASELIQVLDYLEECQRADYARSQKDKIQNSSDFTSILLKIPDHFQNYFIKENKNIIQQYPDFPEDLSMLNKEAREFIEQIRSTSEKPGCAIK